MPEEKPKPANVPSYVTPEVVQSLPLWVKSAVVAGPLLVAPLAGAISGGASGGQAAAQERAVLATKVERLQEDIDKLDAKFDRIIDKLSGG